MNNLENMQAKQYWESITSKKRKNILATIQGKKLCMIKTTNFKYEDLDQNTKMALLELSR